MSASPRGPVGVHVERGNQQRRIKVVGADGEVKAEVPHYAVVQALVEREGIATSLTPDALVEEELRAITVCEGCRGAQLSDRARDKRRHTPRPWLCNTCAKKKAAGIDVMGDAEALLQQIDTCEVCKSRPLLMNRHAKIRRRHSARPWACRHCAIVAGKSEDGVIATIEQDILRVTCCEQCSNRLGTSNSAIARRKRLQRPWKCQQCHLRDAFEAMPESARIERARKSMATLGRDGLASRAKKIHAVRRAKQAAANESTTGTDR